MAETHRPNLSNFRLDRKSSGPLHLQEISSGSLALRLCLVWMEDCNSMISPDKSMCSVFGCAALLGNFAADQQRVLSATSLQRDLSNGRMGFWTSLAPGNRQRDFHC